MRNFVGYAADTNTVTVGSAYGGTVYRDTVDGENVYRFTTRGTAGTAGQWKRGVYIGTPEQNTNVAIEFRFTEAMTADGTAFAPSLGVLRAGQGNGGEYISSIQIFDADGKEVARNNAATGLNVGQWYTLFVRTKATTTLELYAAHNHTADVPTVTMEIRNRGVENFYWATDSDQNAATVSPTFVDGENAFFYTTKVHPINSSEWSRRARLYIANNAGDAISLKVKIESVVDSDGNPYVNTSKAVIDVSGISDEVFTDEEGNVVAATALETGKWYTVSWTGTGAADYALWMFTGSPSVHATAYFKDITVG
jgi:hypothetical protein